MNVHKLLLPTAILVAFACLTTAVAGATVAGTTVAGPPPVLSTNRGCFTVGQPVVITGTGFAPARMFELSLAGGVDLGVSTTDASGDFTATIHPGGLGANHVQAVEILDATDGTSTSKAMITVTRTTGARVIVTGGSTVTTVRAQFQIWGFALVNGQPPVTSASTQLPVYLHYVSPHNALKKTFPLGNTGGQCGYLKTKSRRVFPFVPGPGSWTLQVDTSRSYSKHPAGPVARIDVRVT